MSPDFLLQVLIGLGGAAGVYAAIKADLARAIITSEHAHKAAGEAHGRIDAHIQQSH